MMRYLLTIFSMLALLSLLGSCAWPGGSPTKSLQPTSPFPAADPTLIPISEVSITVTVPASTPANADIVMVILDEVTGWPYNKKSLPLARMSDGRWQIRLSPPAGSLLRYHYLRRSPTESIEWTTNYQPVRYRVLHAAGPMEVEDIIAAWNDSPYQGPTGRIIGRIVDGLNGYPLAETMVHVSGQLLFTDGRGNFQAEGLVPGLQTITAFSYDGAYSPAQQGALIAADDITPAQMGMIPAQRVQVTFEVAVPEGTLEGIPIRIAGNLRQFGHIFTELPAGTTALAADMPTLIEVDPRHYIQIMDLYAGTDLRYKYTLGDGLWNAERDQEGQLITRQVIIPNQDLVIRDDIAQWNGANQGTISFLLSVPSETPLSDEVSLQFNPSIWHPPVPMWRVGDHAWFYSLYGQIDPLGAVGYRYCRNQQCGIADDLATAGPTSTGRQFTLTKSQQDIADAVTAWNWLASGALTTPTPSVEIRSRPEFKAGVEVLPHYRTTWKPYIKSGLREIANLGSNSIILTPTWAATQNNPLPTLGFDPAYTPYGDFLKAVIREAQGLGLEVILHPTLEFPKSNMADWWQSAARNEAWWTSFYDHYESFILTYAKLAAESDISKIVLGGPDIAPALPDGILADGSPSQAPGLAAAYWRSLIRETRAIYPGPIAFELELGTSMQAMPPFMDNIDEIHIYWHAPLASEVDASFQELQAVAGVQMANSFLSSEALHGKPISLSVEYASIEGGATACPIMAENVCLPTYLLDQGAMMGAHLQVDMQEQAIAIEAVLMQAHLQRAITGFYVRRYNPIVGLQDQSASVNGKVAGELLKIWYLAIRGE